MIRTNDIYIVPKNPHTVQQYIIKVGYIYILFSRGNKTRPRYTASESYDPGKPCITVFSFFIASTFLYPFWACTAVIAAVLTISSTEQPRERSLHGFCSP